MSLLIERKVSKYFNYKIRYKTSFHNSYYKPIHSFDEHSKAISCFTELPSNLLASGAWDFSIKIWDMNSFECLRTLKHHKRPVFCLLHFFVPNKYNYLISSSKEIIIFSLDNYEVVAIWNEHNSSVQALTQLKDNRLWSGSYDSSIIIWNLDSFTKEILLPSAHDGWIYKVIQLKNSSQIASCGNDSKLKIWNISEKEITFVKELSEHKDWITCVIQLNNGDLCTGSSDKIINVYKSNELYFSMRRHKMQINNIIQLQNGNWLSCGKEGVIKVWNWKSRQCVTTIQVDKYNVRCIYQMKNGRIVTGGDEWIIHIF